MSGKFHAQLNEIEKILEFLLILEERLYYPQSISDPLAVFRGKNYEETWKYCVSNQAYNFQLKDSSIIQFNISSAGNFSFCYYASPYVSLSYKDFLIDLDWDYNEVGYTLIDEYDLYLSQAQRKESPLMIRYDYAPDDYNEGLHPASHLHIGYDTEIRIGLKYILEPYSFILLIVRQCYPHQWYGLINIDEIYQTYKPILVKYKKAIEEVEASFLKFKDSLEFYLM